MEGLTQHDILQYLGGFVGAALTTGTSWWLIRGWLEMGQRLARLEERAKGDDNAG